MNNELTEQELEIAECIYNGFTNKDIAVVLRTTRLTVRNHIANIYAKLGVDNRLAIGLWFFNNSKRKEGVTNG